MFGKTRTLMGLDKFQGACYNLAMVKIGFPFKASQNQIA